MQRSYIILNQIENSHLMGKGQSAYVDAKVLELLCLQFKDFGFKHYIDNNLCKTTKDYDKIREAANVIISNIHNPPSIRQLSLQVGINEKKLKQGFKQIYNNTVYGYLFDYKMQLAKQLLLDTNKPISEIALKCGYDYPSHFCTAFKRKFGVSPHYKRHIL